MISTPHAVFTRDDLHDMEALEDIPPDEIAWLAAHGQELWLQAGDFFVQENAPARFFYLVIEGELQVTRTINGAPTVLGTTPRGIMGGEQPLLLQTPSPVGVRALLPTRLLILDPPTFRRIFAECPAFGARVLQTTTTRSQNFATVMKQQEKLAALGKLSAGLAHELNNPAAAARRAADLLRTTLPTLLADTLQLHAHRLSDAQVAQVAAFGRMAAERALSPPHLAPLQQSDREDAIGTWLDARGVGDSWEIAASFVAAGLTSDDVAAQLADLPPQSIGVVATWLHRSLVAAGLVDEIEQSTQRISALVDAVKAYSYMDQGTIQNVNIHEGIDNTLKVLGYKLKQITVERLYDPHLPRILARGGELNQLWTNLLLNAIEALGGRGTIRIITRDEQGFVMVEIADNGPGIPPAVLPRIWEPFFTTKDVGQGTGLGLDIAYRVIKQHHGTVDVQSQPGQTRFIVRLPVDQAPQMT
jgi:signal transduction histidine kinase